MKILVVLVFLLTEGGVQGIRTPQNCIEKHKKMQYRIEIYQNTTTVVTSMLQCIDAMIINTSGSPFHWFGTPIFFWSQST